MNERKSIDCRNDPAGNCSVQISGTEDEVMKLAARHAVTDHGYPDSPEMRVQLRRMMKSEET
jgi:hypothetical protein